MHDQTLRMLNAGLTGTEIAEEIQLPPAIEKSWHARGYYGSLSHNVKAVYQRYLGWFDGNPAHLWEHPPVEQARLYVDSLGGTEETVRKAKAYADSGDLRFAATLLDHAVFADPAAQDARALLASVYDRLGHGAENGTWRNFYLSGAYELRGGRAPVVVDMTNPEMVMALTVDQLLDSLAISIDGPRAWDTRLVVDFVLTDLGRTWQASLVNGVLTHRDTPAGHPTREDADLTLTLTKPQLLGVLAGRGLDGVGVEGDPGVLATLAKLIDKPTADFDIVTP